MWVVLTISTIVEAVCKPLLAEAGRMAQDGFFSAANLESTDQVTNDDGYFLTEKALSFALFYRRRAGETARRQ